MNSKLILAVLLCFLLTACGGGSSSGSGGGTNPGTPLLDTDNDGIPDATDPDDDNDGVVDSEDAFPLNSLEFRDSDNDGVGDNADTDDDNDGVEDQDDAFPLDASETHDSDGDGTGDNADSDDDNDGIEDSQDDLPYDDQETTDTDGDGIGDNADTDDDNDGTEDTVDAFPLDPTETTDTDGDGTGNNADSDDDNDGVVDSDDAFPLEPSESIDTDGDGIGNNADTDDDNDGVADSADAFPLDAAEWADNDQDGIGNNADVDDDNDGVADHEDAFPFDSSESIDTDGDGIGNNADTDDDNDGVVDSADAFPLDASETTDTDSDGVGNNADTDDDNDGVADSEDAFPLEPSESIDTDGDGIGNNTDIDDDNDGVADSEDALPLDSSETVDTDGDGVGNNADTDDDNDGVADSEDAFPLDSSETLDTDGDGIGNNTDDDDDNDGIIDSEDPAPLDPDLAVDTDGDGIDNRDDEDDDNDGVNDDEDAFPLDNTETTDTDGDGIGNNADTDDDNDGVLDSDDLFPLDATEAIDTDGDGIGNSADTDDDNDGVVDSEDAFPLDSSETIDTDGDGIGNNTDTDDDNDGVADSDDAFPLDATETEDTDRDGIGNNADTDDDNDGIADSDDQYPTDSTNGGDTDFDGTPNYLEDDDDNDGVVDSKDYFPLDFACSDQSHADHTGLACDPQAAMTVFTPDFTAVDSDGNVLLANISGGIMYRWSVELGQYLMPIQLASQANTTFEAPTAVRFDKDRQRLWLGFNDGRVVYRTLNEAQHQSFVTADEQVGFIFTSNTYIILQTGNAADDQQEFSTYTDNGLKEYSAKASDRLPALVYASEVVNNLVHLLDGKDIYQCSIDYTLSLSTGISCTTSHSGAGVTQLASVPGNKIIVSATGEVFYYTHSDAIGQVSAASALAMGEGGERLLLSQVADNARLIRYDEQIEPVEMTDYSGAPVAVLNHSATGKIIVVTRQDGKLMFTEHTRQTPDDLDGDGVANTEDAFVTDPSASVDTDNDGYPDALHEGSGKASTLVVDQFINDTACWLAEHADDKGGCRHSRLASEIEGFSMADSGQDLLFIFDAKQQLMHRWSREVGDYIDPIRLQNSNAVINLPYVRAIFAPGHQRLYMQDVAHAVRYVDFSDGKLHDFTQRLSASHSLGVVGDYVLFNLLGGSDSLPDHSSDLYDMQGERLGNVYWGHNRSLGYDKSANKLYQVKEGYVRSLGFNLSDGSLDTASEQQYKFKSMSFNDGVTLASDGNMLVTHSGWVLNTTSGLQPIAHIPAHDEFKWLNDGGVSLQQASRNGTSATLFERFDSDYTLVETRYFDGKPRGVFSVDDNLLVITQSEKGAPLLNLITPTLDSDGDGVFNRFDAFPEDVAASLDDDKDGYPDSWNFGYGQSDSTTGLVLDVFAGESACQTAEHATDGICDPDITQAVFSVSREHTFADNEKSLFTLDGDSNQLVQINALNGKLKNPVLLGKLPQARGLTPVSVYYSAVQRRAYLTYPNDVIGYVDMGNLYPHERFFAKAPPAGLTTFNMVEAGNYLVVQYADSDGSKNNAEHYTYALDGELVETRTGIYAEVAAWDSSNNRIVYVEIDEQGNPTDSFKVIVSSYHYISQQTGFLTLADENAGYTGLGSHNAWIYLFDNTTKFIDSLGASVYHLEGMSPFTVLAGGVSSARDYQGNVLFEQYGNQLSIHDSETIDFKRSMQVCNDGDAIKYTYGADGHAFMLTQHIRTDVIHLVSLGLAPLDATRTCYTTLNKWVDTDGDGIGDTADEDDDNDGYNDSDDAFPLDVAEWLDTDGDGIGNNADTDDDNDGIADIDDDYPLDPLNLTDTDGDGTADVNDSFPVNPDCWLPEHADSSGNNCDPRKTFKYFDMAYSSVENQQIFDDGQGTMYIVDATNRKIMRISAAVAELTDSVLFGREKSVRESAVKAIYPAMTQGRIYFHYANDVVTYMALSDTSKEHGYLTAEQSKGVLKGLTSAGNFVVLRYQDEVDSALMGFYTYDLNGALIDERTGDAVVQGHWDSSKSRITYVGVEGEFNGSNDVNLFYSFQYLDAQSGKNSKIEERVNEMSLDSRVANVEFLDDSSLFSIQYGGVIHDPDAQSNVSEFSTFVSKVQQAGDYIAGQSNQTEVHLFAAGDYSFVKRFYSCRSSIVLEYLMEYDNKLYALLSSDQLKSLTVMKIDLSDLTQVGTCLTAVVEN